MLRDGGDKLKGCGSGQDKYSFVIGDQMTPDYKVLTFVTLNYGNSFAGQVCHGCDESPCVSCGELVCNFLLQYKGDAFHHAKISDCSSSCL